MKGHILCDASYDGVYQLASCAGSVVFNGETHKFTERAANISDSSEAELFAIFASLQKLWKIISKADLNGEKINSVQIITDSETAHMQIAPSDYGKNFSKCNQKYRRYRDKIESLTRMIATRSVIKQVAAHQKKLEATPLESKHNEIDAMARLDLRAYRNEILSPKIEHSKYYGINLSSRCDPKKEGDMFRMGYELAESGFIARVHFEGGVEMDEALSNHPYTAGIAYYAKKHELELKDLIETVQWSSVCLGNGDIKYGCNGLDSVLLRDVINKEDLLKVFNFDSPSAKKAGACSRLMFGHQLMPKKKNDAPHEYKNGPSRFLVNFGVNKGERKWLSSFAKRTGMPYVFTTGGLEAQMDKLRENGEFTVKNNDKFELLMAV